MFGPLVVHFVDLHGDFPTPLAINRVPNIKGERFSDLQNLMDAVTLQKKMIMSLQLYIPIPLYARSKSTIPMLRQSLPVPQAVTSFLFDMNTMRFYVVMFLFLFFIGSTVDGFFVHPPVNLPKTTQRSVTHMPLDAKYLGMQKNLWANDDLWKKGTGKKKQHDDDDDDDY
uniref:Uncharacterized protein n=1 Tax=Romanomermis culicivorax TaxID=13658 RepID=A0A915IW79_ROMCU